MSEEMFLPRKFKQFLVFPLHYYYYLTKENLEYESGHRVILLKILKLNKSYLTERISKEKCINFVFMNTLIFLIFCQFISICYIVQ